MWSRNLCLLFRVKVWTHRRTKRFTSFDSLGNKMGGLVFRLLVDIPYILVVVHVLQAKKRVAGLTGLISFLMDIHPANFMKGHFSKFKK